ncbi:diguanylate cyclase/phosphodiesterase (GGDEF & EAL domains) with PAS/PAC sensor(s) [Planococcus halocryophilus Or1]|uniref:Diguanylate cyclase n=1 Tax=Planococcus halocryophilus TaxID=1215089 RepID=A0A1C7DV42_9BACL|nr:EAL domain-containing protein [Planococcus halocryophilus]ANU15520.1 diguanylate cyclase [Planococcus halocryophilus]EMF46107.1 diguanylate cyclase/phosphodiesterase (GGDEF & EAL domains) with PAS/PAC sensor(s) [Planococcus halocryophilus Or1]
MLVYYSWTILGGSSRHHELGLNLLSLSAPLVAAITIFMIYLNPNSRDRHFWLLISLGCFSYAVAEIIWLYNYSIAKVLVIYPEWSDLFYFLQISFYIVAFVYQLWQKKETAYQIKFFCDVAIIVTVFTALSWHFLVQPLFSLDELTPLLLIISVGYPVGDLLLLFGAISFYLGSAYFFSRSVLTLIITSLLLQVFADTAYLFSIAESSYVENNLYNPLWSLALLLMALAAILSLKPVEKPISTVLPEPPNERITFQMLLPYSTIILLFIVIAIEQNKAIHGLIAGASLSVSFIIARQIFTLLDNQKLLFNYDHLTSVLEHKIEQRTVEVTSKNEQLEKVIQKMEELAYYDVLSGLPNRRLFLEKLEDFIRDAKQQSEKFAVVFIDLDRFKNVNDSFGHEFGDLLLQGFSEKIKENLRSDDVISRQGGDEFTIILNNIYDEHDISPLIHRLQTALAKPIIINGQELHISMSIGIAVYPKDGETTGELLKHADSAMYSAKAKGKNNFQFFSDDMALIASRKIALENDMRRAITNKEFVLYYQPQIQVETGNIIGMEALIRWKTDDGDVVSPGEFIPLAEETRLILPIGEWVLYTACEQAKKWHDTGHSHLKLAVNLSPLQFLHEDLMDVVKFTLHKTGFPASSLELEITEGVAVDDAEIAMARMRELREIGVRIAIDDFGTGYSSLNYLKQFPLNNLKIAQPFVQDMATNPSDKALVEAMVFIAHNLNMSVIAEGVETEEQLALLKDLGCDEIQGYLYSKPLSADQFTELIVKGRFSAKLVN